MKKWSIFLTIFFFSIFVCTLKFVNLTTISNISCFRFCWKNEKLDWPKCARTGKLSGTENGSVDVKDTVINEYQALSDCQRDITGHLEMLKMRGEDVLSEKELILLRAGENILISLTSVIEGMFMVDLNLY